MPEGKKLSLGFRLLGCVLYGGGGGTISALTIYSGVSSLIDEKDKTTPALWALTLILIGLIFAWGAIELTRNILHKRDGV